MGMVPNVFRKSILHPSLWVQLWFFGRRASLYANLIRTCLFTIHFDSWKLHSLPPKNRSWPKGKRHEGMMKTAQKQRKYIFFTSAAFLQLVHTQDPSSKLPFARLNKQYMHCSSTCQRGGRSLAVINLSCCLVVKLEKKEHTLKSFVEYPTHVKRTW